MAYSKRIPPIKLKLNVIEFNKLNEILEDAIDGNSEIYSKKANKLKDKLLRYSVPINNDNEETQVDIRLYNNEIVDLFYILFYEIKDTIAIETNYFDVLLRVREKIKEERIVNE